MLKNISYFLSVVFILLGLARCANQGYPEGGPRDETPPRMVSSKPPMNVVNFQGDEIEIEFNELIVLKEALQKVVISPPLNNMPTIRGMGNKVTVIFDEELQPGTTYSIDFADAIQDNNEGNALEGFSFSFSTGETQDSLEVSGHVFEANTLTPVPGVLVMAHSNHADSAFTNMVPPRLAKTNEEGHFTIRNLAEGKYRIYALEDLNRNYKFDQPGERIAWFPQLVEPSYEYRERIDSLFKDSVTLDTVLITEELAYIPDSVKLFLFQEDYKKQYLDTRERNERHRLDFFFNRPLEKPLEVKMLNIEPAKEDWYIYERSAKHDSVMIWLTDSVLISSDSLTLQASYPVRDSLNNLIDQVDTLKLFHRKVEDKRRRGKDEETEDVGPEPLRYRATSGAMEIGASPWLNFPVPLSVVQIDSLQLYMLEDTVLQPVDFDIRQDSIRIRNFRIEHEWEPGSQYQFVMDSAAFKDVFDRVNRPAESAFNVKTEDSYGTIYVTVEGFEENALLQVLDSKEEIVRAGKVPVNGKLAFRYIKPGEYFLRIINDRNQNEEWDTGDFQEDLQPESVNYYPESITIRANWGHEVEWDINEHPIYEFVNRNRVKSKKSRNSQRR
ncbi:Ig-like domain-containing domain [Marinilabilia sp.]